MVQRSSGIIVSKILLMFVNLVSIFALNLLLWDQYPFLLGVAFGAFLPRKQFAVFYLVWQQTNCKFCEAKFVKWIDVVAKSEASKKFATSAAAGVV